jgi:hypothetical protein
MYIKHLKTQPFSQIITPSQIEITSSPNHYNLNDFGQMFRVLLESFLEAVEADDDDAGFFHSSENILFK